MGEKTGEVGGGGWNLFKGGNMEVLGEGILLKYGESELHSGRLNCWESLLGVSVLLG